ncbi:MAG: extracellular matrix regulator RemB [Bacillota bacterium]
MLLHIGSEVAIPKKDIVAIFAYNTHIAVATKNYLRSVKDEERLVYLSEDGKERSIVITTDKVFVTSISCHTLKRRAENIFSMDENRE